MKKNVLFTGLYPEYHYHFVSELNLLEKHLQMGDDVYLLECNASLNACECNKEHDLSHCLRCIGIRQSGVSLLREKINLVSLPPSSQFARAAANVLKSVHTLEDLKKIKIENFDLGMAVYSSLIDHTKSTLPCIKLWQKKIIKLTCDALSMYWFSKSWITENINTSSRKKNTKLVRTKPSSQSKKFRFARELIRTIST